MNVLEIKAQCPYKVFIGKDLLGHTREKIADIGNYKKIVVITDSNVEMIYLKTLNKSLERNGYKVCSFVFESGEKSKNLKTVIEIYNFLCENRITKSDLLVALGGGIVGDITGFVASTYLRGIDYINIPTSFLAQVDSCLGGKTGVNLDFGKNLVGTFYSPKVVLIDATVLKTLDKRNFLDGVAEVLKYGIIKNKDLFLMMESGITENDLNTIIFECLKIKKEIVEKDEFDKNHRLLLNFGHTLAHAIEAYYNFEKYTHGQAVAIGMLYMALLCEKSGLVSESVCNRIKNVLKKYDLVFDEKLNLKNLIKISLNDKKVRGDSINLVLLKDIGNCFIQSLNINQFKKFMLGEDYT